MNSVQNEIRDWLVAQPNWLQSAAEFILSSGSVADANIARLVELVKAPEVGQMTSVRAFAGLASTPPIGRDLRLQQISNVCGIENLGPREPVDFGKGNLCVIYGHNGSGKSGYTRLLNRACGKPRAKELKCNVFQARPATRKCSIGYQLSGVTQNVEWLADGAPVDALRAVDIFDTETAVAYLTAETPAAYTPPAVALFEALAILCDRLKSQLQAEQDGLIRALPLLPSEYSATGAGVTYGALKPNMSATALGGLINWQTEDGIALDLLIERLNTADPAASARNKRSIKLQTEQLAIRIRSADGVYDIDGIAAVRRLRAEASGKRRIATESARVGSARLEGISTDTWRALWEAAREYSLVAYPGREFPVTNDALCVLCQQPLDGETQQRLKDFETFVRSKLEADAESSEKIYREKLDELPIIPSNEESETLSQAAGFTAEGWPRRLENFWARARGTRSALIDGEVSVQAIPIESPQDILAELCSRSETSEAEAIRLEQDALNFDRVKAAKDKLNLEARRWTAQQSEAIATEIARLKQIATYESWKRSTNSQPITLKAGEISQQVITDAFVDRFNRELKALGASRIRIELFKTRAQKGKALHKLRLKGAQSDQDFPESVLSEGERRIVSLAAFLADVDVQHHVAPFVFDDPISSLDHDFELFVAARLAELAKGRQVLVLTHRLSLYGALEDAAKGLGDAWKKQHLHQLCIESFSGVAGHPAHQETWNANTKAANEILITRLQKAKREGDSSGASAYRNLAQGICSDFRKLIERTVEDDLLNQIVRRHRRSVTTDNRLTALPHISQADCNLIDDLMSKYSCYEHSQSAETPIFIPEEPELRGDLESLKNWREDFKKRPKGTP